MELLRSLLLVPGNRPKMIEKARSLPADALMLDLEDGVPPVEKKAAREIVRNSLAGLVLKGQKVCVRINSLASSLSEEDLEAIVVPGLECISPPKISSAADVQRIESVLQLWEKARGLEPGKITLILGVETAIGMMNIFDIARSSQRTIGIVFGADDYTSDMGIVRSEEGTELLYPRSLMAVASNATGVAALDTPYVNFRDEEGLLKDARLARQLGFRGKLVIHPSQIEMVNRVFSPSPEEIAAARKIVEGFQGAVARGSAVTSIEGKMVDTPVAERARRLLFLAEAIAHKEQSQR